MASGATAIVLDCLKRNDSTLMSLIIYNFGNATGCSIGPQAYGNALRNNTTLQEITIASVCEGYTSADLLRHGLFFDFIEKSPSLKKVVLSGEETPWPLDLLERFVLAVLKNPSIQAIELEKLEFPILLFKQLFQCNRNVGKLILKSISIVENSSTDGEQISESCVEQLKLYDMRQTDVIKLLNYRFHCNVKEMHISLGRREISIALAQRLEQALNKMSCLHTIKFDCVKFEHIPFEHISRGLQNSKSLRKVVLSSCDFDSQSTTLFPTTFVNSAIKSLEISGGRYPFKKPLEPLLSSIITHSTLDSIDIVNFGIGQKLLDLATVLKPFEENATLGSLHLGTLSHSCLSDLLHGITMSRGLEEISFHILNNNTDYEETRLKFLAAVRKNLSLKNISFRGSGPKIELLCHRNRDIHNWMGACHSVPTSFWPFAVARSNSFEHRNEIIFKSLLMLGDSVGATEHSRKV